MSIKNIGIIGMLFVLPILPFVSSAHDGATGVVKERMELMSALGKKMKTVADMMKGKIPFDPIKAVEASQLIRDSGPKMLSLFPEGSLEMPSEATPDVWKNWSRFEALVDELRIKSASWVKVSKGGDEASIIQQFAAVGKVCSNCHMDFRKKTH